MPIDLDQSASAGALGQDTDLVRAWVAWLRSMQWSYWTTLAFGYPVTHRMALRAVTKWLAPLPKAFAALGLQAGPAGGMLHVHALVGGVRRVPLTATLLRERWRRGSIVLAGYRPAKGAVEYMTRQAAVIELLGTPLPFRPRCKRVARPDTSPRPI